MFISLLYDLINLRDNYTLCVLVILILIILISLLELIMCQLFRDMRLLLYTFVCALICTAVGVSE